MTTECKNRVACAPRLPLAHVPKSLLYCLEPGEVASSEGPKMGQSGAVTLVLFVHLASQRLNMRRMAEMWVGGIWSCVGNDWGCMGRGRRVGNMS